MKRVFIVLVPWLFSCVHSSADSGPAVAKPGLVRGTDAATDEVIECLNNGDAKRLFDSFDNNMRAAVPLQKTEEVVSGVHAAKGKITSAKLKGGANANTTYILSAERGEWLLAITINQEGKIAGLRVTEPPAPEPPVASNTIRISLPFKGRWSVFWGGDTIELNQHVHHQSQRRAADLLVAGLGGQTFRNDGKNNSDYYAYGQEVLAVADGKVITAIDGVPDNAPGAMNPYFAPGNAVFIEHAPNLYSVYAHLQAGTIPVKPGVQVKRGQVLGLCGNSGNSSEPHLHFQLQDGPLFEAAWGVEPVFKNVRVTRAGQTSDASEYRFLKGDVVEGL